jgi:membrane carboxypeptidase/penicillin-binding protein
MSKYNIKFGNVTNAQFVTGDYNHVAQRVGLAPEEVAALRSVFDDLRANVAASVEPAEQQHALEQVAELEGALVAPAPDAGRVRRALRWFRDNAPQVLGAVTSVVVHPLVGKVVEGAGDAVAKRVRESVDEL